MKIYVSYFYQVRFFPQNYIPISTAMWDPKWYHNNRGNDYVYKDKRGVWCGIRNELLHPGPQCSGLCGGPAQCSCEPADCPFLSVYRGQLERLDFQQFLTGLASLADRLRIQDPVFCLMVHEAPDNPCSERGPLLDWLNAHGVKAEALTI